MFTFWRRRPIPDTRPSLAKMAEQILIDRPNKAVVIKLVRDAGYEIIKAETTDILGSTYLSYRHGGEKLTVYFIDDKFNEAIYDKGYNYDNN